MLISSFLPSTGGQGSEQRHFNSQAEGQDSLRQTILYDYNNKSSESMSQKQFQHGVGIGLLPATFPEGFSVYEFLTFVWLAPQMES